MGEKKQKINIPMCAAFILFVLTLISMHMTSGLFARYTATATGTDSARVAKFDVRGEVAAVVDTEGKLILSVTNHSEVAVKYSIEVELPESLSIAVDGGDAKSVAEGEDSVAFTNESWILGPNAENAKEHTLQFAVVNWVDFTDPTTPAEIEQVKLDFKVRVHAEQID